MKDNKITIEQSKDTGLAIILILLLVVWLAEKAFLVGPAILVLILTMTCPGIFKPLAHLWFGLSHIMGEIVSKVLLSIVFILVATPMGLIRKALGKDAMRLKEWKKDNKSAFIDRSHKFTPEDLENPF